MLKRFLIIPFLALFVCLNVQAKGIGYTNTGTASYYADMFQGKMTANGERFDMHAMTAAHKSLPFNAKVRVTNIDNNKSVVVRINDRGPFVRGRMIDLSKAAFEKIGNTHHGLLRVKIERIQ